MRLGAGIDASNAAVSNLKERFCNKNSQCSKLFLSWIFMPWFRTIASPSIIPSFFLSGGTFMYKYRYVSLIRLWPKAFVLTHNVFLTRVIACIAYHSIHPQLSALLLIRSTILRSYLSTYYRRRFWTGSRVKFQNFEQFVTESVNKNSCSCAGQLHEDSCWLFYCHIRKPLISVLFSAANFEFSHDHDDLDFVTFSTRIVHNIPVHPPRFYLHLYTPQMLTLSVPMPFEQNSTQSR